MATERKAPLERAARGASTGKEPDPVTAEKMDPLASRAIGTASNDLIKECPQREPLPVKPPPPPRAPAFALAFSGGGFRATLPALGVLRFFADAGLLDQLRYISSVSGGSVAHGLVARAYPELKREGFSAEAVDRIVVEPLVERISTKSLTWTLVRNIWRIIGPKTRTNLLADTLDRWFFHGCELEQLSEDCRFIFNAANLTTGVRFGFERDVFGDWVMGRVRTQGSGIRLADAVATSAAVPGAFAPYVLRGFDFPCANGRKAKLVDGGAYDNAGLEPLDDLADVCLVALNAGGEFRTTFHGGIPIVRDLMRANALLYRQSTSLRRRWMVERFRTWEDAHEHGRPVPATGRCGVLFNLASTIKATNEWREGRPEHDEWRIPLALKKTSFARFPRETCEQLLYRGWWLAGATLSLFHRDLLPAELPRRSPPAS